MSGEFSSRNDSHPSKFEWRFQILVKFSFRELFHPVWPGLRNSDNVTISLSSDTNPWINFCDPHWQLIFCCNNWHPGISETPIPLEIAVERHLHVGHGTKNISMLLTSNGNTSWLLLPILVSLILHCTVQPENTYFFYSVQRSNYDPIIFKNRSHFQIFHNSYICWDTFWSISSTD